MELSPPERLLCGPGPTNVDPAVLEAMHKPMLGHLDPALHEILLDVVAMLREAWRMPDGLVLPLHCTGTAGMETGIANLLEPGDTAIVARCGYFGRRIGEIARRHGASVEEVDAGWGEAVPTERLIDALDRNPHARMLAVVHAETSTGVEQPLAELGYAIRGRDTLLMADCVTSLGGVPFETAEWGVDFAYSCTQKCLAAPPGMSPLAVSERGIKRIRSPAPRCRSRSTCCCWSATGSSAPPPTTTRRRCSGSTRCTRRSGWRWRRDSRRAGRVTRTRRPTCAASSRRAGSRCWRGRAAARRRRRRGGGRGGGAGRAARGA